MVGIKRSQVARPVAGSAASGTSGAGVLSAAVAAPALSAIIVFTAGTTDAPPGAPLYWPWLLTSLQVVGLWSAGAERSWEWLLGGAVQVPWIAYAAVTSQFGFIPGCTISAAVQTHNFLTSRSTGDAARALGCRAARTQGGTTWMSSA